MTILATLRHNAFPGIPVEPETQLSDIMDEIDRVCELPFWLEEATGRTCTDAELR